LFGAAFKTFRRYSHLARLTHRRSVNAKGTNSKDGIAAA
jgi:hypothetical protein